LRFRKEQDFIHVAKALGKVLHSSPPHFKKLQFLDSRFSHNTLHPIIQGLLSNSTVQLLKFCVCEFDAEREVGTTRSAISALQTLLASSAGSKIMELHFPKSINNSQQVNNILLSMCENSSIRYLNLAYCGLEETPLHYCIAMLVWNI
jgi:hypothetical protein